MAFATNGAAIIGGMVVPASEVKVLQTLVGLGRPATVPEIATAMNDKMSDASLYSLLGRLDERRRLVARKAVEVEVHGTKLRRITWSAHQAAMAFFNAEALVDFRAERASTPAKAPG